nr:hypothetical protein [Bryobacter aggregatus]
MAIDSAGSATLGGGVPTDTAVDSVFEAMVHDFREVLRRREGRKAQATAAIMESRT